MVEVVPPAARSDADDAIFLATAYGLTPHVWQANVLRAWLGVRRDGQWAASTCGLAVPRQNGKNALIEMRELFGMVALGEKFLHTAHQVKTARKAFLRIAAFFENARQYPELAAMVKEIRKTNGQEAVVLTNGGQVEFVARSKGSARGFTVDILVCDEAQDLTDEELAALLPTTAAAPLGNPQMIVTGTPPDPEKGETGEVFTRLRSQALTGKSKRICWVDYGSAGPMPDVDDRGLWLARNPSCGLPHGTTLEALTDFRTMMSPDNFAREFLGWWGDPAAATSGVFLPGAWAACSAPRPDALPVALGVAADVDQRWLSLAAVLGGGVVVPPGAHPHVGSVARKRFDVDRDAFVAEAARIAQQYGIPIVVDKRGPAAPLIPDLVAAGVQVVQAGIDDLVQASADFRDAVETGSLTHGDYDELNAAVASATWRMVGDRRVFGRKGGDISMLEAAAWALWAVRQGASSMAVALNVW